MNPKVLIIEDDENKLEQVRQAIGESLPDAFVACAKSYQSGLRALLAEAPHLVVLDMTLPTFDRGFQEPGGRTRPFAGREIIEQIHRRSISTAVLVVSGFEILGEGMAAMSLVELDKALIGAFEGLYCGFVYYSPSESGWRARLSELIKLALEGQTK